MFAMFEYVHVFNLNSLAEAEKQGKRKEGKGKQVYL